MSLRSLGFLFVVALCAATPIEQPQSQQGQQVQGQQQQLHDPATAVKTGQLLEKTVQDSKQVLAEAKTGQQVRQCSCAEQDPCIALIESDVETCFHSCWQQQNLGQLASKPEVLKQCFESRTDLVDTFVTCMNDTAKAYGEMSCVADENGPMVEEKSLPAMVGKAEQKLLTQAKTFERTMGPKNEPLIQGAINLGTCMKDCFMAKKSAENCFAKAGCQPRLEENLVGPVVKRCSAKIGWKKEAYELCECFQQAGIDSVKPYCQILRGSLGGSQGKGQQQQQQVPSTGGGSN